MTTEIRNEIARLQRQMSDWNIEGRLDSDTEADIQAEIAGLHNDLYIATHPEQFAPTGGLNVPLFVAAIGSTPEELGWDEAA